ncbi:MAG: ATPase, T2SS/T4P/T4SS family [Ferrimicrobium sp.]
MMRSTSGRITGFLEYCALVEQRVQAVAKQEHLDPDDPSSTARIRELARSEMEHLTPGIDLLSQASIAEQVSDYVTRSMLGAGPLQPLLEDPHLEEIMINGPQEIFVIRSGTGHLRYPEGFYHEAHLRRIIERLAAQSLGSSRALDPSEGIQDISLPDGSRLHLVHPELSATGHMLINLRRVSHQSNHGGQQPLHQLLVRAMNEGATVVIAGLPGSGKTTLARLLLAQVDPRSRIVVAEEVAETGVALANVAHLQTRRARRGATAIDLRTLVTAFLRMAPSIAVVGEIRDKEALPFLLTITSGIPGLTTIHARDARGALTRLRLLSELNGTGIGSSSMSQLIADGIDIVVYQAKIEERFTITQLALVEDITSGSGQTNFVTIDLDIANGMLMAPIPQHARILQRYPALRQPMTAVPIGELA